MIGGNFRGIRVGERKKMAAAANGNGVQQKVTYLSYTVFNPSVMLFRLPRILGRRAHVSQTVVFIASRSMPIYAPLRCQCGRAHADAPTYRCHATVCLKR